MKNQESPHPSCALAPYFGRDYSLTFATEPVATFIQERCEALGDKLTLGDKEEVLGTEFILDVSVLRTVMRDQSEERGLKTRRLTAQRFHDENGKPFVIAHDILTPQTASMSQRRQHRIVMGFPLAQNDNTLFQSALSHGVESLLYDQLHPEDIGQDRKLIKPFVAGLWAGLAACVVLPHFLPEEVAVPVTLGSACAMSAIFVSAASKARDRVNHNRIETIEQNAEQSSQYLPSWPISIQEKHTYRS